ncbi:MAG: tetratricopeptide repeat protein [Candidatus Omnitrophica bacterium]|nr:tetratricopeptide repeat protein [Candidatus Omnitrophota bacterium]
MRILFVTPKINARKTKKVILRLSIYVLLLFPFHFAWPENEQSCASIIEKYTKEIQANPDNSEMYYKRGYQNLDCKNYDQALEDATRAIELDQKEEKHVSSKALQDLIKTPELKLQAKYYELRADAFLGKHDYAKAVADYTTAAKISNYNGGDNNLAIAYCALKQYPQAIAEMTKVIKREESSPWNRYKNTNLAISYNNRGMYYFESGDYNSALADFNKAIELGTGYAGYLDYVMRSLIYSRQGNFKKASEEISNLMKKWDNLEWSISYDIEKSPHPYKYFGRAFIYFLEKKYDNAWKDVHKIEELGQTVDPEFLNELKKASGRVK